MSDSVIKDRCLYLQRSSIGCHKFQRVQPKPSLKNSSFLTHFTLGQPFTSTGRPFCLNRIIWTVTPLQGWQSPERQVFLPGNIWYLLQKTPKSASQDIFDNFSDFLIILLQVKLLLPLADPSIWIASYELCLVYKGNRILRKKVFFT